MEGPAKSLRRKFDFLRMDGSRLEREFGGIDYDVQLISRQVTVIYKLQLMICKV